MTTQFSMCVSHAIAFLKPAKRNIGHVMMNIDIANTVKWMNTFTRESCRDFRVLHAF